MINKPYLLTCNREYPKDDSQRDRSSGNYQVMILGGALIVYAAHNRPEWLHDAKVANLRVSRSSPIMRSICRRQALSNTSLRIVRYGRLWHVIRSVNGWGDVNPERLSVAPERILS